MKELIKYQNGNTTTTLLSDGTKRREYYGIPQVTHPESIDVKITNYCDMGCSYCHESSTVRGKHADLEQLLLVLKDLPAGVELAIGGGNPLSHPDLKYFLTELQKRGIIANITVNQGHLKSYQNLLIDLISNDLVKGIGISITNNNFNYIKPLLALTNNIVYHIIAGINQIEVIAKLNNIDANTKVLILGYKHFGFGVTYFNEQVTTNLTQWKKKLPSLFGMCTLSFDNLAIEQLEVKKCFTQEGWERFYMGDDFCFTMYIDAVEQKYAPTSRNPNREQFNSMSLLEYFQNNNLLPSLP